MYKRVIVILFVLAFVAGINQLYAKKENLLQKTARVKSEGKKALVLMHEGALGVSEQSPASASMTIFKKMDTLPKEYDVIKEIVTKKLNEGFKTDIFEIADMTKLPLVAKYDTPKYQEQRGNNVNIIDWEKTDYSLIVEITVSGKYESKTWSTSSPDPVSNDFRISVSMIMREIVKGKHKFVVRNKTIGFASKTEKGKVVLSYEKLRDEFAPAVNFLDTVIKDLDEKLNKYIQKKSK